jgi:Na+/H+-dicarboxylate symporter
VIALISGFVVGMGVAYTGNAKLVRAVSLIEPIGAIWVNAIRMTVVPLVVSLLIAAIVRGTEGREVGRIGGLSFGAFMLLNASAVVLALVAVPPIMSAVPVDVASVARLQSDAAAASMTVNEQVRALPGIGQWIASLAPVNVVKAAADGAMLPLIVFTVLFALALRRITPERRDNVMRVFDGIGEAMLQVVRWLIALAPLGVFTLIAPTAARLGLSLAGALGFYVVAYSGMMVLTVMVVAVVGALGSGVGLGRFFRAAFPAQAVAFSSSSSLASLPALIDSGGRLGLPQRVTGFVMPLAVSSFKVGMAPAWLTGTLFLAHLYGVQLGIVDYLTVVATAVALGFATPGVPNATFLLLVPLLASVSVPAAGVALLIAVDSIPDLFATTANVTADLAAASLVQRWSGSSDIALSPLNEAPLHANRDRI